MATQTLRVRVVNAVGGDHLTHNYTECCELSHRKIPPSIYAAVAIEGASVHWNGCRFTRELDPPNTLQDMKNAKAEMCLRSRCSKAMDYEARKEEQFYD